MVIHELFSNIGKVVYYEYGCIAVLKNKTTTMFFLNYRNWPLLTVLAVPSPGGWQASTEVATCQTPTHNTLSSILTGRGLLSAWGF